ncbi:MAG: hypothetical protein KME49_12395 [Brasilonema octagenarum HA4186-MV1]|jgi:predicted NACHT family NTPase|nr:hypothetical protein [Brasilonema octagenarum HA4186-MV1]
MSEQVYGWKRFWCPRSGHINLADSGYLYDPDSKWGREYNPDLVSFEEISHQHCLVLLGEPGIGKTRTMEAERVKISSAIKATGDDELNLDLNEYKSEDRLIKELFESPEFTTWARSTHSLYIFLDSLDQCLLRIDTVAALLANKLKKYQNKAERLFVRITCRTAVWSITLEERLRQIWGKDGVGVYELAPLRRTDVKLAAASEGVKSEDFLEEVWKKNVVPLAIKPVTLEFLLNTYRHSGQFLPNQTLRDLYLDGCRLLCGEVNRNRRESGLKGNLENNQRLIIAARIAAVIIFAKRFAVWTDINQGDVPEEDVLLQKLCWGHERANGREFEVTEAGIEEVLDTGLFSSRGLYRMGWAHQTYAEFLAAWYLKQHQVSLPQILKWTIHPDCRVVPQLQETTAWLSSMIPEVFQEIVKTDPDVLLQSDISTATEANKFTLVDSLLKLHDEGKLSYQYGTWEYRNLNHPKLAEQLQLYIDDSNKDINARRVAIDITRACCVEAVQNSLASVALDPQQLLWVRIHAALTIGQIADEQTKARLKPLALGEVENDPEDQLKGYAMLALYPNHMSAEEVFSVLTQPKANYIGGKYQDFVAYNLGQHLTPTNLSVALKWLEQQSSRRELHYPFDKLSDAIMLKAWEYLKEPNILEGFAKIAYLRLKNHDEIIEVTNKAENLSFQQQLEVDDCKRRQLIKAMISILPDSEQEPLWLAGYSQYSSLTPLKQDFSWLIERLQSSEPERVQKIYAKLIRWKLDWKNSDQMSAVITASQYNSTLKAEFALELEPIEFNSPRAEQAKTSYLELQNLLKPCEQKPLLEPPPKQRVVAALERVESGDSELWWQVCVEMTLIPTSTHYSTDNVFEPDVTKLPGWEEAEADTKVRILKTAKVYLDAGEPETQTWLETNNFSHPPFAGYQALHLLSKQEPEFIPTISPDIWVKWIPIIFKSISFSDRNTEENNEHCREIVRTAYQSIPNEFIETLIVWMIQHNYQPRAFYFNDVYRLTKNFLDEPLVKPILSKVKNEDLNAGMLEILLEDMFSHEIDEARVLAVSFISPSVPSSGEARDKAVVAARILVLHADNSSWLTLWSAIQQDSEFGREVLESIAFQAAMQGQIEQQLKEEYLADLYIFLARQYPEIEEREQEAKELSGIQARTLGEIDDVRMWKNYIPQRLQERGTPEACDALQKIIRELPELESKLHWRLLEAEALARRKTWQPPQPEDILQIVTNQSDNQSARLLQIGFLNVMSDNRTINTGGGSYYESINTGGGHYIQGNYINMSQDLTQAASQIQDLIEQLQKRGVTVDTAQEQVANDLATQAQNNPTMKDKLVKWGQSLGDATVSDVVKGVVKLAIRSAGIPLP